MYEFRNDMPMYSPNSEEYRFIGIAPLTAGLIGAGIGFIGGSLFSGPPPGPIFGPFYGPVYAPGFSPSFYGGYPVYGPGYYPPPGYGYGPY